MCAIGLIEGRAANYADVMSQLLGAAPLPAPGRCCCWRVVMPCVPALFVCGLACIHEHAG